MRIVLSVHCFLTIISYVLGHNEYNQFWNMEKIYEQECTDGQHHYHWYPYDCQKYYSCIDGKLEVKDCPSYLYWNDDVKACDIKENVDCSGIIPYVPDCTNNETAYYFYPYDCQMFYECFGGVLYTLVCPADSLWNDDEKACDESGDVDCSNIIPRPSSSTAKPTTSTTETTPTTSTTKRTTTTRITTTTTPAPPTTPECTYEHQYFQYPYDCSKYFECSNGKAVLMDCPEGEFWNQLEQTCDWPYNVDCVPSPSPIY